MLKGMLEFSRPVKLMTSQVDVNKLITDLLEVLGSKAKERGIAMIPELSTDLPKVEADPDKIHRVLQNIIANAVQASPEGETIKIPTAAQGGYWGMGPGMMGSWGMGWFGGVFIILFWILVIVALVFFIRWLVRTTGNGQKQGLSRSRALEILKERYARGEINTQEFDEKRRLLES